MITLIEMEHLTFLKKITGLRFRAAISLHVLLPIDGSMGRCHVGFRTFDKAPP